MAPAQQRFETADGLVGQVEQRLIRDLKLFGRQRLAKIGCKKTRRALAESFIPDSKKHHAPRPSVLAF
jgi:hypothetical protein